MIEAHTFDAWTRASVHDTIGFRNATILGGFAAPLFLFLAGVSIPLAVARAAGRDGYSLAIERVFKRGLEVFLLAFAFRLQAFIVSPGSHPIALFRVDILNVMGLAIAAAALVMIVRTAAAGRIVLYSAIAAATAMVTPIVRALPSVDALPIWIQWYLRPAGEHTTFTLLPWAGFVFGGAAVGALISGTSHARASRGMAAAGAMLVAIGWYTSTRPSIYAVSSFWTSSPTWFAIRLGIVTLALAGLSALDGSATIVRALRPLETFGRHSLFVYWIHVELVYGYASWMWKRSLPLWGTAAAYVVFSSAMYGVVKLKTRSGGWIRPKAATGATPEAAPA